MSPKNKIKNVLKIWFVSLDVLIFANNYFYKMKYSKSKCLNKILDAHLHDTLDIAAPSTERNVTTIMQQKTVSYL